MVNPINSNLYPVFEGPKEENPTFQPSQKTSFLPVGSNVVSALGLTQPQLSLLVLKDYRTQFPDQLDAQKFDPVNFRSPNFQSSSYKIPTRDKSFQINLGDLKFIRCHLTTCLGNFNPNYTDLKHPLHFELYHLTLNLIQNTHNIPTLNGKIEYLEKAVAEVLTTVAGSKKANGHQFELLEIALRHHLFQALVANEKHQLNHFFNAYHYLPAELHHNENALVKFLTKSEFYNFENLEVSQVLLADILPVIARDFFSQVNLELPQQIANLEALINSIKQKYQLDQPSLCAREIESTLRTSLAKRITSQLASQYKVQYLTTGLLPFEKINEDFAMLEKLISGEKNAFPSSGEYKVQLLSETLGLIPNEYDPFVKAECDVGVEKETKLVEAKKARGFIASIFKRGNDGLAEIEKLYQNKMQTLEKAKEIWNGYYFPSTVAISIPSETPSPAIDLDDFIEILSPVAEPVAQVKVAAPQVAPTAIAELKPVIPSKAVLIAPKKLEEEKVEIIWTSYVDIAFASRLKGADKEVWTSLPPGVKVDVLRHLSAPHIKGKAEDIATRIFKNETTQFKELNSLEKSSARLEGLKKSCQELIKFYYSMESIGKFNTVIERLKALEPDTKIPVFLSYVGEIAMQSGYPIPDADALAWATENWSKPEIVHCSILALEQYLNG